MSADQPLSPWEQDWEGLSRTGGTEYDVHWMTAEYANALEARAASAEARNQQLVADGVIWIGIGRENDKLRADLEAAEAALKLATEALEAIHYQARSDGVGRIVAKALAQLHQGARP